MKKVEKEADTFEMIETHQGWTFIEYERKRKFLEYLNDYKFNLFLSQETASNLVKSFGNKIHIEISKRTQETLHRNRILVTRNFRIQEIKDGSRI